MKIVQYDQLFPTLLGPACRHGSRFKATVNQAPIQTDYLGGVGALASARTTANTTLYAMVISARRVDNTGDDIIGNRLHVQDGLGGDILIEIMFDKNVQTHYLN